jgi:hypothetical protein
MTRTSRGLTIAEALVTLGLVVFVFNLTAGLLQSYIRTTKFAGGVDKAMEASQTALNQIRKEVRQAISVVSPSSSGAASGVLTFNKVWSESPARLPDSSAPFPVTWEPHDPTWVDTVTYDLQEKRLLRTSLKEELNSVVCADLVESFQAQVLANGNISVELAIRQDRITRKFSSQVFLGLMR